MNRLCAMLIMFLALPIVGGCDNRKDDLVACRIEAVRRNPDAKDEGSLKDYSDFVTACMQARGYKLNTIGE